MPIPIASGGCANVAPPANSANAINFVFISTFLPPCINARRWPAAKCFKTEREAAYGMVRPVVAHRPGGVFGPINWPLRAFAVQSRGHPRRLGHKPGRL